MVVPSSGAITLRGLANEKVNDDYTSGTETNCKLGNLATSTGYDATNTDSSSYPNSAAPHGMSEWYSYDHDAISLTSFNMSKVGNASEASSCGDSTTWERWHDGGAAYPDVGDTIYNDSGGSGALNGNDLWFNMASSQTVLVGTDGVVDTRSAC